ncbi:MAG: TrmJ/YjtD family RNA methyltransferase [Spirochaeta sp.]|nr:TrmJ/YjtD family RNA methyltransferase [Spirochaeta sp.]
MNSSFNSALKKIRIVLVNPKESSNVGAVCRSMKTMGINSLYLVGARHLELAQARILAVHARDLLEKAVFCSTLKEALENTSFAAGISRRKGKRRKYFALSPETLAEHIATHSPGLTALVFGNEESGLSHNDLSRCHTAVSIPSSPDFPSLNLSHAVQIITYHLFRRLSPLSPPEFTAINSNQLEFLVDIITESLKNIGFFTQVGDEDLARFFRDILARAGLSGREAKRMEIVFRKISGLAAQKGTNLS